VGEPADLVGKEIAGSQIAPKTRARNYYINQKGRSEIVRRIDKESQGIRLRRLGWEEEEERERLAREIKRKLFCSSSNPPSPNRDNRSRDEAPGGLINGIRILEAVDRYVGDPLQRSAKVEKIGGDVGSEAQIGGGCSPEKIREINNGDADTWRDRTPVRGRFGGVNGVFWYTKHVHYTLVWICLWN
jgi:hypothetical protein